VTFSQLVTVSWFTKSGGLTIMVASSAGWRVLHGRLSLPARRCRVLGRQGRYRKRGAGCVRGRRCHEQTASLRPSRARASSTNKGVIASISAAASLPTRVSIASSVNTFAVAQTSPKTSLKRYALAVAWSGDQAGNRRGDRLGCRLCSPTRAGIAPPVAASGRPHPRRLCRFRWIRRSGS
jgi:hypothetical protein